MPPPDLDRDLAPIEAMSQDTAATLLNVALQLPAIVKSPAPSQDDQAGEASRRQPRMSATQTFRELTYTMRPQDPRGDGTGLRFETGEHGGDYPDNMPQAITVTDVQGRWAVYVPLRVNGKIVVPQTAR